MTALYTPVTSISKLSFLLDIGIGVSEQLNCMGKLNCDAEESLKNQKMHVIMRGMELARNER